MTKIMINVLCLVYLGVNTYTDLRRQEVIWPLGMLGIAAGLILHMILQDETAAEWILGVGVGVILALVSIMTKESIGLGDCLVIAVIGSLKNAGTALLVFMTALLFSAVYVIVIYVMGAVRKKARFPFVPFIMIAFLILYAAGEL